MGGFSCCNFKTASMMHHQHPSTGYGSLIMISRSLNNRGMGVCSRSGFTMPIPESGLVLKDGDR